MKASSLVCAVAAAAAVFAIPIAPVQAADTGRPLVIGHRGAHGPRRHQPDCD